METIYISLTQDEAFDFFDSESKRYLNMGAQEFIDAWETGKFDDPDQPDIMYIAMLLPFVNRE